MLHWLVKSALWNDLIHRLSWEPVSFIKIPGVILCSLQPSQLCSIGLAFDPPLQSYLVIVFLLYLLYRLKYDVRIWVLRMKLLYATWFLFQFRAQVHKFVLKSPCFKEEKKGLENCHKSQSFFTGINLMPTNGGEKSQTMSTTIQDSTRVRLFSPFQIYFQTLDG